MQPRGYFPVSALMTTLAPDSGSVYSVPMPMRDEVLPFESISTLRSARCFTLPSSRFAAPLPRRRTNTRRMTTACMRLPPLASGGDGGLPVLFVETDQDPLAVGQDRPAQKPRLLFDPIEPFFVAELLVLQAELTVHPAPGADERPRAARKFRGKPLQRFPVGRVVIDMHRDEVHAL